MAAVVVGIDGSTTGQRALEWAAREAKLRDAQLRVVHAYRTEWVYYPEYAAVRTIVAPTNLESEAKQVVDGAIDRLGDLAGEIEISTHVINDANAANALLECAADADLVVVGSRGLGGFAGLLLGSVSQKVAHHTEVPLVIVPAQDD